MNKKNNRFIYFFKDLYKTYKSDIIPLIFFIGGIAMPFILIFWYFFHPSLNCGGDLLLNTSKNIECGKDIQKALQTFSQNMSMPYKVEPGDYKTIFDKGQIQKEYDRDGIHYTAYFNINKTKEGCFLKFFKRGKSQPGHYETTLGNYGSVAVNKCQCE